MAVVSFSLSSRVPFYSSSSHAHHRLSPSPALLLRCPSSRRHRRFRSATANAGRRPERPEPELSVLRFTFGIPGFDESYLPRYLGAALGSLLLLNHFVGSNGDVTGAQLRTEVVGVCLAAFSVVLPYLGRFLKGFKIADGSLKLLEVKPEDKKG